MFSVMRWPSSSARSLENSALKTGTVPCVISGSSVFCRGRRGESEDGTKLSAAQIWIRKNGKRGEDFGYLSSYNIGTQKESFTSS